MNKNNNYIPDPIDTSGVKLSEDILVLMEILARNTHEVWSQQKLKEGWKHGSIQSQGEKITPYLIPYDDLTEDIKQYDRNTAMETLKFIIALGYRITKENK